MIAVSWGDPTKPDKQGRDLKPLHAIAAEVCRKHGITEMEFYGRRHARRIAWPRQEAYWRAYHETGASLPLIGRTYGNRDHTTVLFGIKRHEQRMKAGVNGTHQND